MNELILFPNIRYVGGADCRGLDLYVDRMARYIRVSLNIYGCLNFEQVVAYGHKSGSNKLINLSFKATAGMSSVREDDESRYGPQLGTNGIINGYNYFATKIEDNPWWCVDLGEICHIETLHIMNVLHSAPDQADTLRIDISADSSNWEIFYNRSAPEVVKQLVNQALSKLRAAIDLPIDTKAQKNMRDEILAIADTLEILLKQQSQPNKLVASSLAAKLLDLIENFIPKTQELRVPIVVNTQLLQDIRKIYLRGNEIQKSPPIIKLFTLTPNSSTIIRNFEFDVNEQLAGLMITPGPENWRYNNLQVLAELENGENVVLHDHGKTVKLCEQLLWVAYLMGDITARSIAMQSIPKLMLRDADNLHVAYLWARTRLHGKDEEFRLEVLSRFENTTNYDTPDYRLAFCRHAFSTPHRYRNKRAYAKAIKKLLSWLETLGVRSMLLYGTLLGAVREGTLIDHDDDVDVGFICTGSSEQEFIAAKNKLIQVLIAEHWEVSDDRSLNTHATFSVLVNGEEGEQFPIELFPLGISIESSNCAAYMQRMEICSFPAEIIGTRNSILSLEGVALPAPAKPELFLALRYGNNWRTPDPLFEI